MLVIWWKLDSVYRCLWLVHRPKHTWPLQTLRPACSVAASFCDGLFYQATVGLELWSKGAVSIICVLFLSLPALIFCFVFLSTPILLVPAAQHWSLQLLKANILLAIDMKRLSSMYCQTSLPLANVGQGEIPPSSGDHSTYHPFAYRNWKFFSVSIC